MRFWMLIVVAVTVNPCWYFVNEWVIAYLQDSRQLDALRIAGMAGTLVIATVVFLVADLGNRDQRGDHQGPGRLRLVAPARRGAA